MKILRQCMMIPAVAMMLLSVSSCDSGIREGTFDDVSAAIPGGASAATMTWRQVDEFCDFGGKAADIFGRVCCLKVADPVALVRLSGGPEVLMSAISDVAVAEDATGDWERVELGRDGIPGRVCVAEGGTVVLGGRFVWLVPRVADVQDAVAAVSAIPDAGGGLPQPVREALKPRSGIAVALSIEDKYLTATIIDRYDAPAARSDGYDVEDVSGDRYAPAARSDRYAPAARSVRSIVVEVRGELRDSTGAICDLGEYALPIAGPISDRPACVAVALGLRRGALARAVSKHLQPHLGVKEKLAFAAVADILRDVCGTLRATLQMEGSAATVRVSMPYAEGGAAAASHRVASMIQRFGLQGMASVDAVGDTLMRVRINAGERPRLFDDAAPSPDVAPDVDGDVLMALSVAPVSVGIAHLEGAEAVVRQRGFVVTLYGTDLRRLSAMLHPNDRR